MDVEGAKRSVTERIEQRRADLIDTSHQIWANPELCFEEHFAHDLLSGVLESSGFAVERRAYGLDTAFVGRFGDPSATGPTIAMLCEYDALPRSATRAVTTSSPLRAWARRWVPLPSSTRSAAGSSSWGRRPKRAVAARSR